VESLVLALHRATHATLSALAARVDHLGLGAAEVNALANLADGPCTTSELAALVGSRPTTITGIVDRLERAGLVIRTSRPGDRRVVEVGLTAAGQRDADEIAAAVAEIEREALASLVIGDEDGFRAVVSALSQVK
jgi:DNA-binding MarR family transcriptional regulator